MATAVYRPTVMHVACGTLDVADVNTGTIVIPNDKSRRIYITDCWVRPAGSPGAGTAIVYLREYLPNVICASVQVNDTVTINGTVFTAKAAQDITARQFNQASTDGAAATSLAACINDPTFGVRGLKASVSTATVTLIGGETAKLTTSNTTRLAYDSGGNSFVTFAKNGLSNAAIKRAGATNATTCTYLSNTPTTRYPVEIKCNSADLTTTTALEYVIKYVVL